MEEVENGSKAAREAGTESDEDRREKQEVDSMEEGNAEKESTSTAAPTTPPKSPTACRRVIAPIPNKRPVWLHSSSILAMACLIGALTIMAVSIAKGGLSRLAMGFLIVFAIVLICFVPVIYYTRASHFVNSGMMHCNRH